MDLVVSRHKHGKSNRTAGGNRLPDFGEEALSVRGKVVSGVTRNPLSYSKDTLLISREIKNPYPTDWG